MATSEDITSLLGVIKRLYLRIIARQIESCARPSVNTGKMASSHNITQPLSNCINKLTAQAVSKPLDSVEPHTPEQGISTHNHTTINRDPDSLTELGELSLHLKDSHKFTGTSQDTGTRLVLSTWEHFHTTIRFARQGDAGAARVHMDLTNSALNEAAHYLPEQEYARFSKEVIEAIEEITKQI